MRHLVITLELPDTMTESVDCVKKLGSALSEYPTTILTSPKDYAFIVDPTAHNKKIVATWKLQEAL